MFKTVSELKKYLDTNYGDIWPDFEPETISSELEQAGYKYDEVLNDRIEVLRCIETSPDLLFDDALFFLHAVDVLNGNKAQFSHIPMPTSLELAWAIEELKDIFGEAKKILPLSSPIKHIVTYILKLEGYRSPTAFFTPYTDVTEFIGGPEISEKEKAIQLYIEGMKHGMDN
jgi:hypothetical protein